MKFFFNKNSSGTVQINMVVVFIYLKNDKNGNYVSLMNLSVCIGIVDVQLTIANPQTGPKSTPLQRLEV